MGSSLPGHWPSSLAESPFSPRAPGWKRRSMSFPFVERYSPSPCGAYGSTGARPTRGEALFSRPLQRSTSAATACSATASTRPGSVSVFTCCRRRSMSGNHVVCSSVLRSQCPALYRKPGSPDQPKCSHPPRRRERHRAPAARAHHSLSQGANRSLLNAALRRRVFCVVSLTNPQRSNPRQTALGQRRAMN